MDIETSVFETACLKGDKDKVKQCLLRYGSILFLNGGLQYACEGGHLDIVHLLIEHGATYWIWGLAGACLGGHLPVVQLMIEKGAKNWAIGLFSACKGGHMELVQLMIEKGAFAWNWALCRACDGGHMKIVALMLDKGASNFVDFNEMLSPEKQLQVYNLVTKDEVRLKLEKHSPAIKERLRLTTIVVINDRLPDHLIRTIVMEYL